MRFRNYEGVVTSIEWWDRIGVDGQKIVLQTEDLKHSFVVSKFASVKQAIAAMEDIQEKMQQGAQLFDYFKEEE